MSWTNSWPGEPNPYQKASKPTGLFRQAGFLYAKVSLEHAFMRLKKSGRKEDGASTACELGSPSVQRA
jgi:hypothetical protein